MRLSVPILFIMSMYSRFFLHVVGVVAIAGLGACSGMSDLAMPSDSPESEVRTAGGEAAVERYTPSSKGGELSPLEQHKLAKAQVDPAHVNKKNVYVKTVKQVEAEQQERQRLASVERDLSVVKNEFKGMKTAVDRASIAQAPVPKLKPAPASASISPAAGANVSVKNVRTGSYPDKTRLVFDLDGASDFQFDLDNENRLLVIRLGADGWDAPVEKIFKGDKVIRAYAAKPSGGGNVVALKLNRPVKVLMSQKLDKNAAGYNRIFFDVAPL